MPTHGTALSEGQTAEFVGAGTKALILIANRLGPDLAHNWAGNGEAMQRAFLGALMPPEAKPAPAAIVVPEPTITTYGALTVDYDMVLEAMVKAGQYDWVDPDITAEHFPIVGKGKVQRVPLTVHFGRDMDDADVTTEFERLGLEDGAIEELTAFGAKYPELQREFPILARKSVWRNRFGRPHGPCLDRGDRERSLYLYIRERRWLHPCRFLAFRK